MCVCGDAKSTAHSVEEKLAQILGGAKRGSAEKEGASEAVKQLKERSRLMLDELDMVLLFCIISPHAPYQCRREYRTGRTEHLIVYIFLSVFFGIYIQVSPFQS
jgi:hypothetical protein